MMESRVLPRAKCDPQDRKDGERERNDPASDEGDVREATESSHARGLRARVGRDVDRGSRSACPLKDTSYAAHTRLF